MSSRINPQTQLGYLETIGRVSGQPHEIEIWFAAEHDMIYLMAGGGMTSDWVRNLLSTPAVRFRVDGVWVQGTARLVTDPGQEMRVRRLVSGKYYGVDPEGDGELPNEWSRTALPVIIDLPEQGA